MERGAWIETQSIPWKVAREVSERPRTRVDHGSCWARAGVEARKMDAKVVAITYRRCDIRRRIRDGCRSGRSIVPAPLGCVKTSIGPPLVESAYREEARTLKRAMASNESPYAPQPPAIPIAPLYEQCSRVLLLRRQADQREDVSLIRHSGATRIIPEGRYVFALVVLGVLWRTLRFASNFPFSVDEASTGLHLLERSAMGLLSPLGYAQVAPVGFLISELGVSRIMGGSETALRLLPWLQGVLAFLLFWRLARITLNARSAMLATGVFGSAYYVVRHGAEAKPYAGDLLIALVLVSLAWAVLGDVRDPRPWLGLVLLAPAAVWFSYPAVFVAGGVGVVLTLRVVRAPSRRLLVALSVYGFLLAASFLAMFLLVGRLQARSIPVWMQDYWSDAFPPVLQPWRLPLWLLDIHTGVMLAYPVGGSHGASTLTLLCVVAGVVTLYRNQRGLVVLLISPLPLAFVAAAFRRYPYGDAIRTSLYMAPAFCLLAGAGLETILKTVLPGKAASLGIRVAAVALAAIAVVGMAIDVAQPYKTFEDAETRRVVRLVTGLVPPGDELFVVNGNEEPRFHFYLSRFAGGRINWDPKPTDYARAGRSRIALIVWKDQWAPLPVALLQDRLAMLAENHGAFRHREFPIDTDVTLHLFDFSTRTGTSCDNR
jgi:hypothetical protein